MSWHESTPGLYQRPLGGAESSVAPDIAAENPMSREPILIHTIVDFTAPDAAEKVTQAFRDAWKALRLLKSPDIATAFGDGNKYYKIPSPEDLEAWLDQTFTVTPIGTSIPTAIREMQARLEWLPVCYFLPQPTQDVTFKGTIMLFISHWRTEASGTFKIINQLLDYASDLLTGTTTRDALSSHVLGSEVSLLTPDLENTVMPDRQATPEAKARIAKRFTEFASALPCIDFPLQAPISTEFSALKVLRRTYSPTSTTTLVQACKAASISVTAAVHAAYLAAVWQVADPAKRTRPWTAIMPAQVRTRLPRTSPLREQGCWNSAQMMLISVRAGQGFAACAKDLQQQYALANSDAWLYEEMREISKQTAEFFASITYEPVATPFLTSFGVLDRELIGVEHGGLEVQEVEVWADNVGPGLVLGMWTFRGKLSVQITWNASYHGEGQIEEVLDHIEGVFAAQLGIDMQIEKVRKADY